MTLTRDQKLECVLALCFTIMLIIGVVSGSVMVWGTAAASLTLFATRWMTRHLPTEQAKVLVTPTKPEVQRLQVGRARIALPKSDSDNESATNFIEALIAEGRTALLCRPELAKRLTQGQLGYVRSVLYEDMALISDGHVRLNPPPQFGMFGVKDCHSTEIGRVLLDRFPVTNCQYKQFVADGGYKDRTVWDSDIFTSVRRFVDQTHQLGPRFWKNGKYRLGEDDHPVIGVNWYEAQAYSRWVGKRLPTDAEWVSAAGRGIEFSDSVSGEPLYPWGSLFDEKNANLWATDRGKTVPVTSHPAGCSSDRVYQLVGNVWEWTSQDFAGWSDLQEHFELGRSLKSIRGGAYDTYFESHATCQFQSGESPLARRHNIGFRCVLSVDEIASELALDQEDEPAEMAMTSH